MIYNILAELKQSLEFASDMGVSIIALASPDYTDEQEFARKIQKIADIFQKSNEVQSALSRKVIKNLKDLRAMCINEQENLNYLHAFLISQVDKLGFLSVLQSK